METIIEFIKLILPSLTVSLIMLFFNSQQKKREGKAEDAKTERIKIEDEREADRRKAQELQISLTVAIGQLTYAVAMAIKRGEANGEVEDGIEAYNEALKKLRTFEREQLSKNVAR